MEVLDGRCATAVPTAARRARALTCMVIFDENQGWSTCSER